MGPSGAGKSTVRRKFGSVSSAPKHSLLPYLLQFINNVLEHLNADERAVVDDGFTACTSRVEHYAVPLKDSGRRLVLVDTPGFDNDQLDSAEVVRRIATWLEESCVPSYASVLMLSEIHV